MDKYKIKWTGIEEKVFRYLCINVGIPINQRGIARDLRISPTSVGKAIKKLEKQEFVKCEIHKTANLVSCELNRDSQKAVEFKRIENLEMIYESKFHKSLVEKFPGCTIILFGSYSFGEDVKTSDIDIAIIGSKEKEIDLKKFEDYLERKISLHFFNNWDIDKNLRNNILNGIILEGGVSL